MPELPEVQTTVDGLNKKIKKRRITGVWFGAPKLVKKPGPKDLEKQIKGSKIIEVKRRGKNILIYLDKGNLLLIHMKMTGHLLYGKWKIKKAPKGKYEILSLVRGPMQEKVNDYIRAIFYLDNGFQFALSDLRKFAKMVFGKAEEMENSPELAKLGPDPTDKNFTFKKFKEAIKGRRGKIKQVLMDQGIISGIGNIYSDEILWFAKINPLRSAGELGEAELKRAYFGTKKILKKALKLGGTSTSDYRNFSGKPGLYSKELMVYGKEGEPCPHCATEIKRMKIGGRSAHYCPHCQRG
jgi:formamidopyrimidine-DNA glycosylase